MTFTLTGRDRRRAIDAAYTGSAHLACWQCLERLWYKTTQGSLVPPVYTCIICGVVKKRKTACIITSAELLQLEARGALMQAVVDREEGAMELWSSMYGTNMNERLALADLLAKKYNLP